MSFEYEIHPKIGVARLGNSPDEFYSSPETIGGLPAECKAGDEFKFKDSLGRVKRQAAVFKIFRKNLENSQSEEVSLQSEDIKKIVWTSHVANKKPTWYAFSELQGNLDFGEKNSYRNQHIPVNNPDITDDAERKKLILIQARVLSKAQGRVIVSLVIIFLLIMNLDHFLH